ncbi:MAG: DeoR/GlpR transcriptional regulator [Oscillospiraceae bacterium]|nr:DeoR/GlpR transcriptional regulator [Oscillospiraceae bacterium]
MNQLERKEYILRYLEENKKLRVRAIAKELAVSEVTVRSDLIALEAEGLVIKTHGGAMATSGMQGTELPSVRKSFQNSQEKKNIGAAAALIKNNDIVILDAGSTTLEIAKNIKSSNVTVITNDIQIAFALAKKPNIKLFMPGGEMMKSVYTLVGNNTTDYFKSVCADKVFLGCDAVDIESGITNRTFQEVAIKQAMLQAAKERYVVFDQSKLGRRMFVKICPVAELDCVITGALPDNYKELLQQYGIRLIEVNNT